MDKRKLRSSIFLNLDGIVTAPIVSVLNKKQVFQTLIENQDLDISEFSKKISANEGYLNIALRTLASQGFLNYKVDNAKNSVTVSSNVNTIILLKNISVYDEMMPFLKASTSQEFQAFDSTLFESFIPLFEKFKNKFGLEISENEQEKEVQEQILKHLEGCLLGPIIVQLGMSGMFHKYFMETSFQAGEFHKHPENFEKILEFLTSLNWFVKTGKNYKFTEIGLYFARRASSYGVTVSYLPMFNRLEELIFGDPKKIREISAGEEEIHVDRKMNVWGSGGAHSTYFKTVTDFIVSIFNQPIQMQPKGILDMGCGNGAFIQHIFETIERHTLRGKLLEDHPIFLVGADYNEAALQVTRANLIQKDIWAKVIWGDIGNPQQLAEDLKRDYEIELSDLLNIRTFLDHNRVWETPINKNIHRVSESTGAFAFRGERLSNNVVEESLKEHLEKWLPFIKKNGLLVIELHTISPELTRENLGKTAATAYDATHGFSDQYIVEVDVFQKVCAEIGLKVDENLFKKFPDSNLATVSINLLKA